MMAGMLSQAVLYLIQADLLPSQLPLWDTSNFISESSLMGELLHAMLGYEASPTAIQALVYLGSLLLFFAYAGMRFNSAGLFRRVSSKRKKS
jgi:high-affinity iron transporter